MTVLWAKSKTAGQHSGLAAVEAGQVTLDRPTVIFLTGVSTTMNQPGFVAGGLSHLKDMVDSFDTNKSRDTDLYAWSYSSKRSNFKSVFNYNCLPDRYYSRHAQQFVQDFLLQHMADNCRFDKKGRLVHATPKPKKDVSRAFQNLTFLAYSFGSVFSQEVYNAARDTMGKIGYSKKDTRFLLSRIHLISLGAVSRPMMESNRFTSICMVATNDVISNHKRRLWFSVREMFASYTRKLTIRRLSPRNLFISAPVQPDLWEPKKDKQGNVVMRNVKHLFPKWWIRHSHHELPHYTTDKDYNNQFAKIARFALLNCINRKRALKAEEMIQPPSCLPIQNADMAQECEAYQKRIARALPKA